MVNATTHEVASAFFQQQLMQRCAEEAVESLQMQQLDGLNTNRE